MENTGHRVSTCIFRLNVFLKKFFTQLEFKGIEFTMMYQTSKNQGLIHKIYMSFNHFKWTLWVSVAKWDWLPHAVTPLWYFWLNWLLKGVRNSDLSRHTAPRLNRSWVVFQPCVSLIAPLAGASSSYFSERASVTDASASVGEMRRSSCPRSPSVRW